MAHFLIVSFPAQGHINPALHFAKRLLRAGARVTFATSVSGYLRIDKAKAPKGLQFVSFSDGNDDGFKPHGADMHDYMLRFQQRGIELLKELFEKSRAEGNNITCLVYTLLLTWAAEVAREFQVRSAVLWIQPASVFDVYYYYFRGYGDVVKECDEKGPSWSLELPNLQFTLKRRDLPSFLVSSTPYPHTSSLHTFLEQIEELEKEETPTILVNTFEELEVDALKAIERFTLIPVGPLLPSTFLDRNDTTKDNTFGGDLFKPSLKEDYITWLDSQATSTVVYVSFGSLTVLSKAQTEELARALLQTHKPFLWVIREMPQGDEENELSCIEELKQQGKIVSWCSQVEVLCHPSVGCFVTHCGWNSTLESITSGVPMVGFPQWSDQTTNAKLVEDVWKIGVRVNVVDEDGVLVKSEEIKRCLDMVMESEEMSENAKKWSHLAIQAASEGGSSDRNLKAFIQVTTHQSGFVRIGT